MSDFEREPVMMFLPVEDTRSFEERAASFCIERSVVAGAEVLRLFARSDRGHSGHDKIVRLELAQQLPGNATTQQPETEPFFVKENATTTDVTNMIRKALADDTSNES